MTARQSNAFMSTMQTIHRTGAATDDHELHNANWWTVHALLRLRGAEDLMPMVLGVDE